MSKSLPRQKSMIGMIHVAALPATPKGELPIEMIAQQAAAEARILTDCGFDAIMIENMHDRPYVHGRQGPQIVAAMTRIGLEVRNATELPLGVQILSGGNHEAIAVAQAVDAGFIRCENFVFAHVADEGLLTQAEAGLLLRYRKQIGAEDIDVFCDIKKKHASHAITADVSLAQAVQAATFFGADGVIVTGEATGCPTDSVDVAQAKESTDLPVLVGSGVCPESLGRLFEHADGLIVGSWFKRGGLWSEAPDPARCNELIAEANRVRGC